MTDILQVISPYQLLFQIYKTISPKYLNSIRLQKKVEFFICNAIN